MRVIPSFGLVYFEELFYVIDFWIHHAADSNGEDVFQHHDVADVCGIFLVDEFCESFRGADVLCCEAEEHVIFPLDQAGGLDEDAKVFR